LLVLLVPAMRSVFAFSMPSWDMALLGLAAAALTVAWCHWAGRQPRQR
jgi:hypothetical protein